jgi:hypothetical protein
LKFLADECCDVGLVSSLRKEEHDVQYVLEIQRGGSDDVVLRQAYQEERILLTEDKDFGELVFGLAKPAGKKESASLCALCLGGSPCAHDYAHKDCYDMKGRRRKMSLYLAYEDALTLADDDINENWQTYRERFLDGRFP